MRGRRVSFFYYFSRAEATCVAFRSRALEEQGRPWRFWLVAWTDQTRRRHRRDRTDWCVRSVYGAAAGGRVGRVNPGRAAAEIMADHHGAPGRTRPFGFWNVGRARLAACAPASPASPAALVTSQARGMGMHRQLQLRDLTSSCKWDMAAIYIYFSVDLSGQWSLLHPLTRESKAGEGRGGFVRQSTRSFSCSALHAWLSKQFSTCPPGLKLNPSGMHAAAPENQACLLPGATSGVENSIQTPAGAT